ncbi:MAG: hypothetical protein U9Q73_00065 [Nanoarchaeota archaeon]|nr:hypothetical protein [Nanoarchaeota archaeon]
MSSYGLIGGRNDLGVNSRITGNIYSKGFFARSPSGRDFCSISEVGLENYTPIKDLKENP